MDEPTPREIRDRYMLDHSRCEARRPLVCRLHSTEPHHILMKSQGGKDEDSNLMAVCRPCHDWIHAHPEISYSKKWLRHWWD
jgi:5-methylcytosine-specific restriction protein A